MSEGGKNGPFLEWQEHGRGQTEAEAVQRTRQSDAGWRWPVSACSWCQEHLACRSGLPSGSATVSVHPDPTGGVKQHAAHARKLEMQGDHKIDDWDTAQWPGKQNGDDTIQRSMDYAVLDIC